MKKLILILIIGLILLISFGCKKEEVVGETKELDDGKRLEFKEEWRSCEVDEDCIPIDLTCCGCKNIPLKVPTNELLNYINEDYYEEFEAKKDTLCKNIICPEESLGNKIPSGIYKRSKEEARCTPYNYKCSANKICRSFNLFELLEDVSDENKQMAIDLVKREHPEIIEKIPNPMYIHLVPDQPDNIELFYLIPSGVPEVHNDATIIINVKEQKIVSVNKRGIIWKFIKEMYECKEDSNCIRVDAKCCGCSFGEYATTINREYINYWKNEILQCPEEFDCSVKENNYWTCFSESRCINGKCEFYLDYEIICKTSPYIWCKEENHQPGVEKLSNSSFGYTCEELIEVCKNEI